MKEWNVGYKLCHVPMHVSFFVQQGFARASRDKKVFYMASVTAFAIYGDVVFGHLRHLQPCGIERIESAPRGMHTVVCALWRPRGLDTATRGKGCQENLQNGQVLVQILRGQ